MEYQGLTVSFGSDTKAFDKSVKSINQQLQLLRKDMTALNRDLKFNPDGVDSLVKKINNFKAQIELNQTKVAQWKKELETADNALVKHNLEQSIKSAEKEIERCTIQADKFQKQLDDIDDQKSFRNLEKESANLSAELDVVNRKLKLDPTNADLLTQKFKLTSAQVANARDKVEALKKEQQSLGKDKMGTEQWKILSVAIGNAEADVMELEKELQNVEKQKLKGSVQALDDLGNKAQESSKKMALVHGAMTAIGTVAGNFLTKAIGSVTNSIGDMIKRSDTLSTANRNFQNMGFSAQETEKMMKNLDKSISGLPTPMNEAVQGVQLLASATGDLSGGQQIFTALNNAILGFGGSAQDVSSATMQLSQDLATGTITASTFNSMINANMGPALTDVAKKMGLKGGAGELKESLSKGKITAKEFTDTMIELNKTGLNGKVSFEKMAKDGTQTLSTQLANMKTAVVRGGANVVQAMAPALMPVFAEIQTKIGQVATDLKNFFNSADGKKLIKTMSDIGKAIVDGVGSALEVLKNIMAIVYPLIVNNIDAFKALAVAVIAGVVAFKGFSIIQGIVLGIQGMVKAFKAYQIVNEGATVATWALNTAMKSNPAGLIVAGIAALVAGLIYFFTQTETGKKAWKSFTDFLVKAWDGVKNFFAGLGKWFSDVWKSIQDAFSKGIDAVVNFVKQHWDLLLTIIMGPLGLSIGLIIKNWNTIKQVFFDAVKAIVNFFKGAWNGLVAIVKSVFDGIKVVIDTVFKPIVKVIGAVLDVIKNIFIIIFAGIAIVVLTVFNTIMNTVIVPAMNFIRNAIQVGMTFISGVFTTVWTAISSFINTVWTGIKTIFTTAFTAVQATVTTAWNAISSVFMTAFNAVKNSVIVPVWNAIKTVFTTAFNAVKSTVSSAWSAISGTFSSVFSSIKNTVSSIWNSIKSIFSSAFGSVRSTVSSAWDSIATFFSNGVNKAVGFVKGIGGKIASHFTGVYNDVKGAIGNLFDIGKNIVDGIINGIKGTAGKLMDEAKNLAKNAVDSVKKALGIKSPSRVMRDQVGVHISSGVAVGILKGLPQVMSATQTLKTKLMDSMENIDNSFNFNAGVGFSGTLARMKSVGYMPAIQSASSTSTTLSINVKANNANADDISRAIEQKIVRRLSLK